MVRAQITVENPNDLIKVYAHLNQMARLEVLKVENNLENRLGNVTVLFNYQNRIIVEIQLRIGKRSASYYSNNFLYQLTQAKTVTEFKHLVMVYANRLVETDQIYLTNIELSYLEQRQQEIKVEIKVALEENENLNIIDYLDQGFKRK